MSYTNFGARSVNPEDELAVESAYNEGYVCTRTKAGNMERVRSLRVKLSDFSESSENRRILRKFEHELTLSPIPYPNYSWEIHKLGKDFYDTKFGKDTFSANKIKELFTTTGLNFTNILAFASTEGTVDGYCIAYCSNRIVHYAYPFYKLEQINTSFGIYMMTKAIQYFHEKGLEYIYLGSVHESSSLYKLQFKGLEWFDEKKGAWSVDLDELKNRVRNQTTRE